MTDLNTAIGAGELSQLWSKAFVCSWTSAVAEALNTSSDSGWIKAYPRYLRSAWLRGPFLDYADGVEAGAMTPPRGRNLTLRLESTANIGSHQPVVMRLPLAGAEGDALAVEEHLFRNVFHSGCRNRIRKAQQQDFSDHWLVPGQSLADSYDLLCQIHQRLGSPIFPRRLLQILHDREILRILEIRHTGALVAVLALVIDGDIAWVPWCGARTDKHALAPNHMTHWMAIRWAIQKNCRVFDFGRSPFGGATWEFKRKWGAQSILIGESAGGSMRDRWQPQSVNYKAYAHLAKIYRHVPTAISRRLGPHLYSALAM